MRALDAPAPSLGAGVSRYTPFIALVAGLGVSQWVRTLPALAADGLSASFALTPAALGIATGLYHAGFALGQVPCGVALDRYGVRRTVLGLMSIAVAGIALSATAPNLVTFAAGQLVTGFGCCGGLMCALRWAAHALPAERFGAASGYILAAGSSGLLASGTPSALAIEAVGWRGTYAIALLFAAFSLVLALLLIPRVRIVPSSRSVLGDAADVARLFVARPLLPCAVLAFVGYAAFIVTRGLWAGPWLTDHLGLKLVAAGDALLVISLAMAAGPALWGFLDARVRSRTAMLGASHVLGGLVLLWLAAGGGGTLADVAALTLFMALTASHVLVFAMVRLRVDEAILGKAMSAVNFSFFAGAAVLQPLSGAAAGRFGVEGAFAFLGGLCVASAALFLVLARRQHPRLAAGAMR
ncbi:MAG: MFS transporter [Acetobacteraceae bacterium]|nr:MFS transporter [Acetobacteraceae bacterium]